MQRLSYFPLGWWPVSLLLFLGFLCTGAFAAPSQTIRTATLIAADGTKQVSLPHVLAASEYEPEGSLVRFRLQFELPAAASPEDGPWGIYVPKLSLSGRAALNGEFIAACDFGVLSQLRCLHRPYLFVPPSSHWRAGPNTLEFEVFATSRQMNGLSAVTIGPAQALREGDYGWRRFIQVTVANGLAWAAFCMGGIVLCVSLALRGDRLYGCFGVTALAIALCNLNYTLTAPPVPPRIFSWFVFSINHVTMPLLMLTVMLFFRRNLRWAQRGLLFFMVAAPAAIWASGNNRTVVALLYVPFMLFGPLLAAAALRWSWRSHRKADHWMAWSFACVVASSFIDWFRLTGQSAFEGAYLVTYVIPSTVVVMGATLAGQLATALQTARDLATTLDRRVAERTEALTQANQRLEALSTTDGLTGLANRRHFNDILAKEWQRARRHGTHLALIMIDVDHFKRFNDTHGHLAGDDCLRQVAKVLAQRMLRGSDTPARFGGEEFAIITSMDLESALQMADLIRQDVESQPIALEGKAPVHVSVSVGVTAWVPDSTHAPADLIALADEALYQAKHAGRNCVRSAVPKHTSAPAAC